MYESSCRFSKCRCGNISLAKIGFDTAENEPCEVCPIRQAVASLRHDVDLSCLTTNDIDTGKGASFCQPVDRKKAAVGTKMHVLIFPVFLFPTSLKLRAEKMDVWRSNYLVMHCSVKRATMSNVNMYYLTVDRCVLHVFTKTRPVDFFLRYSRYLTELLRSETCKIEEVFR